MSLLAAVSRPVASTPSPARYGPVPTERQLRWHELEFYGMIHFGINTFTDTEWGSGDASPGLFNPTAFDASQVVQIFKEAGMKGIVLTCKHHDGFCLWPSQFTDYSVKRSPWRNGQGDVVQEFAAACQRHGLGLGIYLSPWDRNHKDYGRPEYLTYYRNQLRELLTNYGDIFISWHDGAQGGDGYYGGAKETRKVDRTTYYDWPRTWELIRQLQPMAVIFSDAGPDVRWVGNEHGSAGDPSWATMNLHGAYPGMPNCQMNEVGVRNGPDWAPAECNVSLRPWWFYHARDDGQVKNTEQLVNIYFATVGRGACLNLNVPLDTRGMIHPIDATVLRKFRRWRDAAFATNLLGSAQVSASAVRGRDRGFGPESLRDAKRETYWSTPDEITSPELICEWTTPVTFNLLQIRECLPLGQRVEAFALDVWRKDRWTELARGTSIGNRRLLRLHPATTTKVRLRIIRSPGCPALAELGLFQAPEPGGIRRR